MKRIIIILALMTGVFTASQAQTRADKRQVAQQARIAQGQVSGELTMQETVALRANQRHVRRVERRAKSDGTYTRRERIRVEKKQDRASRRIRRSRHDADSKNN